MKLIFYLVSLLILSPGISNESYAQEHKTVPVSDGPYIFAGNNEYRIKWILGGTLKEDLLSPENFSRYKKKFSLMFEYADLNDTFSQEPFPGSSYDSADSIAVIADIHGDYSFYIRSLRSSGIIGRDLSWSFGSGHLVILGDVFDRGDRVTEVLWHLFGLEKQALKAGGRVHFILGNHELMILDNNSLYINEKYRYAEASAGTDYTGFFNINSLLGRWMRTRPVMLKINDILFAHGGISAAMVRRCMPVDQINQTFCENLIRHPSSDKKNVEDLTFLNEESGPVWYRGYFTDNTLCENTVDSILSFYGSRYIVVGHTPHTGIATRFGGKIIGADTGNQRRRDEILIIKDSIFYRSYLNGRRSRID